MPLSNGVRPKASCSISGKRNGIAPVPSRKNVPPTIVVRNSGRRNSLQVEQRILGPPEVDRDRATPASVPTISDAKPKPRPAARAG